MTRYAEMKETVVTQLSGNTNHFGIQSLFNNVEENPIILCLKNLSPKQTKVFRHLLFDP